MGAPSALLGRKDIEEGGKGPALEAHSTSPGSQYTQTLPESSCHQVTVVEQDECLC